jgi:hypothetical protein
MAATSTLVDPPMQPPQSDKACSSWAATLGLIDKYLEELRHDGYYLTEEELQCLLDMVSGSSALFVMNNATFCVRHRKSELTVPLLNANTCC